MTEPIGQANVKREPVYLPASPHQEHMAILKTIQTVQLDMVQVLEEILHALKKRK